MRTTHFRCEVIILWFSRSIYNSYGKIRQKWTIVIVLIFDRPHACYNKHVYNGESIATSSEIQAWSECRNSRFNQLDRCSWFFSLNNDGNFSAILNRFSQNRFLTSGCVVLKQTQAYPTLENKLCRVWESRIYVSIKYINIYITYFHTIDKRR